MLAPARQRLAFETRPLADGVALHLCPTRRFKTITLKAYVEAHLDADTTLTALLPYVLRRGCRRAPTQRRIVLFLESLYGASLSVDVLKLGERQLPQFRLDVIADAYARGRQAPLRQAVEFLGRLLYHPVVEQGGFRAPVVASEGENLRHFIEGLVNDPMEYASERMNEAMCEGEAFARYEYGRLDEIAAVDPKRLLARHRRLMEGNPIHVFAVGDFDADAMERMAARAFRARRRGKAELPATVVHVPPREPRRVVEHLPDLEQGKLVIGWRTGLTLIDAGMSGLAMFNGLFGAFSHSRLFRRLRERDGLAYYVETAIDKSKGLLFLRAGIPLDALDKARTVIEQELASIAKGEIGAEELEMTRQSLKARIRAMSDNPARMITAHLEGILNGRPVPPEEREESIERVTAEQVAEAARRVRLDTEYFLAAGEQE